MTTKPMQKRLITIEATIPTGVHCYGCDYVTHSIRSDYCELFQCRVGRDGSERIAQCLALDAQEAPTPPAVKEAPHNDSGVCDSYPFCDNCNLAGGDGDGYCPRTGR